MSAALKEEVADITIRQWVTAIPANGRQYDLFKKPAAFEPIARHCLISKLTIERKCPSKKANWCNDQTTVKQMPDNRSVNHDCVWKYCNWPIRLIVIIHGLWPRQYSSYQATLPWGGFSGST